MTDKSSDWHKKERAKIEKRRKKHKRIDKAVKERDWDTVERELDTYYDNDEED